MTSDFLLLKIFILTGITAYIVGPTKFKIYSRQAGHLVGSFMKLIRQSTAVYQEVSKDKDISKVSEELKTGFQELNKIGQQFNIARNIMRSPSQIVNLATQYDPVTEAEKNTKKTESTQTVDEKSAELPKQDKVIRNMATVNRQLSGAHYVSKTAVMIKQHKENSHTAEEK